MAIQWLLVNTDPANVLKYNDVYSAIEVFEHVFSYSMTAFEMTDEILWNFWEFEC